MYRLDKKDKKILSVLDMDARLSISQIAKRVGLSKEVTNYRIKKLTQNEIITGYYAVLDTTKLGYFYCRLFLKFQNLDQDTEKEIINYWAKDSSIGWLISTDGDYDFVISILTKDIISFKNSTDKFYSLFSHYIQAKFISIVTNIIHFKHNYLYDTKDLRLMMLGKKSDLIKIDDVDIDILRIVSKDSRIRLLDIADRIGISPNTIKYRLKKLVDEKIILGFRLNINIKKLGYQHFKIFLYFHNFEEEKCNSLIEYLKQHQNIIYITESISEADLEFEIILKQYNELYDFMKQLRMKFKDLIKNYKTSVTYEVHLINYFPD
ncbi:MAG: Lrp/AsnC family transcriptional regulator [Nanoarchaeota archaeon]|nr:Lrp/AsnC family transcriptional regulator [Nanoarchaeota archaeon]